MEDIKLYDSVYLNKDPFLFGGVVAVNSYYVTVEFYDIFLKRSYLENVWKYKLTLLKRWDVYYEALLSKQH